jgi:hypothetical protein
MFWHVFRSKVFSSMKNLFYFDYIFSRFHSLAQNIFVGRLLAEEYSGPSMEWLILNCIHVMKHKECIIRTEKATNTS